MNESWPIAKLLRGHVGVLGNLDDLGACHPLLSARATTFTAGSYVCSLILLISGVISFFVRVAVSHSSRILALTYVFGLE